MIDAMRKTVSSVIGVFAATSASAVPVEPREASVSDHRDGQSGRRPAVEDLSHRRLQVEVIDPTVRVRVCSPSSGPVGDALIVCAPFLPHRWVLHRLPGEAAVPLPMPAGAGTVTRQRFRIGSDQADLLKELDNC